MKFHLPFILILFVCLLKLILAQSKYCSLCRNHVACRPKRGFGRKCGADRSSVKMIPEYKALWLQVHNGMRSIVASGNLKGFKPATRMAFVQWSNELAKLASLNARQCYAHYDKCRRIVKFPRVGQNVHIDREEGKTANITQSIYRTSFRWFNEYERTDASGIESYHIPRNVRKRYNHFGVMVQDHQTHIGCAAVQFYDVNEDYQKIYWVCNYAVGNKRGAPIYEGGAPASKCLSKNTDFPNVCKADEPIQPIAHQSTANTQHSEVLSLTNTGKRRRRRRRKRPSSTRTRRRRSNIRRNSKTQSLYRRKRRTEYTPKLRRY